MVLVIGYYEVTQGRMTPGTYFTFIVYLGLLTWPLIAAGWILAAIPRARAAARRVEEIFATEPERDLAATPVGVQSPVLGDDGSSDLAVRNLTFRYPGSERVVLEDVSFELRAGGTLGVVGPVGAGKSTLVALLTRLYPTPPHTVFLGGRDLTELSLQEVRARFAIAPQDVFLFSDTIRGNVQFGVGVGASAAPPERLARAVESSALEQDLELFAQGLDQIVGERGVTLSGGQKQRTSLARALLADRAVLVLDDTLSAVDHGTETRIVQRLQRHVRNRTTILIAHRLTVVKDADLILTLVDGRVTERGTHQELLAAGGYYARTWRRQQAADELEAM
jgi:ATP-binding cassette subfamily B protein